MYVGMLTAPLSREPLSKSIKCAKDAGIPALEIAAGRGSPSADPFKLKGDRAKEFKATLKRNRLTASSIAHYANITHEDPKARKEVADNLKACIDLAKALGVDTVCTLAGLPTAGKSRIEMIEAEVPEVLTPILEYAAGKKIRIALENWFATNIQNLEQWRRLFEVLPHENLGLNYDPSHLYWLEMDYLGAVEEFAPRIFHTHAKDTIVYRHRLRDVGVLERGWWRYCIPGLGNIDWGEYVGLLRKVGYDGVLSIEHEDGSVGREEGFRIGAQYLKQFL